ncbi:hypothetical protein EV188_103547 [Actinomycetospora succinea]|uniref:DUF559 domain-containing protein n=1 Tax=Actinomycetospora succinea TaxID=663603 RepID=A0A4R6VFE2_9PSEU|nr:hypothetical protein EV188_103547 [Actinomycetospora succinea]
MGAAAPDGLILVRDLRALGVPSSTIVFRCRKVGGVWWRPLLGLVALARGVLTVHQRLVAALLVAGDDAVVTGLAACRLHGLERVPEHDEVHVLIPHRNRHRSEGFLVAERTKRMPTSRILDGIRCAALHRALLDGARRLSRIDDVRALLCEAVQRHKVTVAALRAEIEAGSCRGAALVRIVIAELEDGILSAAEAWLRELVLGMDDFPAVRWNVELERPDGSPLATVDGLVDGVPLVIELHSFAHHADLETYDATMRRHGELAAAGYLVVPLTPKEVRDDPAGVRRKLRAALEELRARQVSPSAA